MIMLYFSGTGNSEYIARRFSERMGVHCHSIEEDMDFAKLLADEDTVAVCYPIYGSCAPRIMRDFVERHRAVLSEKKFIILCTQMMFSGDGARAFARLLPGCDDHVVYAEHFNMPNNISNFWLFPVRDSERNRKQKSAEKNWGESVGTFKALLSSGGAGTAFPLCWASCKTPTGWTLRKNSGVRLPQTATAVVVDYVCAAAPWVTWSYRGKGLCRKTTAFSATAVSTYARKRRQL